MKPDVEPFLNVSKSVTGRTWIDRLDPVASRMSGAIAQQTGLSEILARIVAARGVPVEEAERFVAPAIRDLMPDPSSLMDMDGLAERLADAARRGETIGFFGDYDVDGACSVALMSRYFSQLGIRVITHIPDRIFEGYGPNIEAMDRLIAQGATLIVTLDCGTTSHEPIVHARARGADVLVIDHHLAGDTLPPAGAIVNPNRKDDISQMGYLCAAGVSFMVLVAVNRLLRGERAVPDLMALLDIVAMATVCDVVPLVGLNRAFVVRGLEVLRQGGNAGLRALAIAARAGGPIGTYHLGYLLGPRINAGGRIGDAGLGAKLLATEDEHEALSIAAKLDELNAERQRIEAEAVEQACATAEMEIGEGEGPPVLVAASPEWHPGIVGLVAARLRERFERPSFAVALRPDGSGTGSGRSMPGVDLGAAVIAAVRDNIIVKGGGHAMAAGVTIGAGQIGAFRNYLSDALEASVREARKSRAVKIDAALTARAASADFVHDVERAGPFGAGNPTPIFAFPAHQVRFADVVGAGGHVRLTLASGDGANIKAIAFRAAGTPLGDALLKARDTGRLHVCGALNINHWQGRETAQLRIIDAAIP
ncbi:single-stranded-DNA-specific exonuclease RecJ [Pelagibacterium lentulum]|uniref:Single-stranded-DNA-specific exonuclease RecJ n=1 Tax=Pelagibacterium lentulum TaxID=2029865 RepID=A0A916VXP3_9HYPH|nr:single-stranded-DNA-specific exonuclease RecJ [Pelagibacterium lentulum]GGA51350.1 single-stranded-DNA-specific exonuclease RecJ [Pelagibacterium lentulum]